MDAAIKKVFESFPKSSETCLMEVRGFIYGVAAEIPAVGQIDESLKWGQPTYSTIKSKSGTPIRLGLFDKDKVAIFFHCQTTMIQTLRLMFPETLEFTKNRGIVLDPQKELPVEALKMCIEMALTYHLHPKAGTHDEK